MGLLLIMCIMSSCSNGWSVGNFYEDSTMYSYIEIMDQDSTSHFYANKVRFDADNWCFTHNQWEAVKEYE